jgi:arabinosyltransferase C
MQRVYWPSEVAEFMSYFHNNAGPGDALIAIPGVAVPDDFENPTDYQLAIPDLNAVMSGWGGIKTYAGHWSETPNYVERRQRVMSDLFSPNTTRETAYTLMTDAHANYIIAPKTEIARQAGVPDPQFYASLGEIVFEGDEWLLVRFRPSP